MVSEKRLIKNPPEGRSPANLEYAYKQLIFADRAVGDARDCES